MTERSIPPFRADDPRASADHESLLARLSEELSSVAPLNRVEPWVRTDPWLPVIAEILSQERGQNRGPLRPASESFRARLSIAGYTEDSLIAEFAVSRPPITAMSHGRQALRRANEILDRTLLDVITIVRSTRKHAAIDEIPGVLRDLATPCVLIAADGTVRYANRAARRDLVRRGLSIDEIQNRAIFNSVPGLEESGVAQRLRDALSHRLSTGFSAWIPGLNAHFDITAYPTSRGLALFYRDTTDRRAFDLERKRLHAAAEASSDVIGIVSTDARILFLNAAAREAIGVGDTPVSELPPIEEFCPADDRARLRDEIIPTVQASGRWNGELELLKPGTGAAVPMLWNVVRVDDPDTGTPQFVALVGRDLTERLAYERELRATGERFEAVVRNAPYPINVRDRDYRYLLVNAAFAAYTRQTPEAHTGRSDVELFGQQLASRFRDSDRHVLEEGRTVLIEESFAYQGESITFLTTKFPLHGAEGNIQAVCTIAIDISDRKRLESALQQQADLLRDADRRKDEFIAMLAHELRNPLSPIRTAAYVVRERANDQVIRQSAAMIERQSAFLARLVDDLLDMARLTQGRIEIVPERVDLRGSMANAVETVRGAAQARQIGLSVMTTDAPLPVMADPVRIEQVFVNLIANAVKFSDSGSNVEIEASRVEGMAEMIVRDFGRGMPKTLIPHIFDMFVQSEQDLDRSLGGLGLGLAIARRLAELHGGEIAAESAGPGMGSTFRVRLPLAE